MWSLEFGRCGLGLAAQAVVDKTSSTVLLRRLALTCVCSNGAPWFPPRSFSLVASSYSPELYLETTKLARGFINFFKLSKIQSFLLSQSYVTVLPEPLHSWTDGVSNFPSGRMAHRYLPFFDSRSVV